jgi:hypothetical protein
VLAVVATAVASVAVAVVAPTGAGAVANAVVPTTASPGTSSTEITSYQSTDFPPNDDGTYPGSAQNGASPMGFDINFYGTDYNAAFVNNNGNITFDNALSTYTPFGLIGTSSVIIAAFFADVDTRGDGSADVNFGQGMLDGHKVFVVNWPGVGCFNSIGTVLNNFQLIVIDRPDRGTGALGDDFDIEFNYNTIQWDAGQASGSDAQCLNAPDANSAAVGFSNGSTSAFELPGSQISGGLLDSNAATGLINHSMNSSTLGRYLFTVHAGQPATPELVCGIPITQTTATSAGVRPRAVPAGTQLAQLVTADGAAADAAGSAVAVSGSTAVVGAPGHQVGGKGGQGAVYVFTRKGTTWSQTAELTANDGSAGDAFGTSVAIKGGTIVVGAPQHAVGPNAKQGAVYVFGKKKGAWTKTAELTATTGATNDAFGCAVAVSGSTVVVGAIGHDLSRGAAFVFKRKGTVWSQTAQLTSLDGAAGDMFGRSVAIAGSTIVVGAFEHQVHAAAGQGAAYVFVKKKNVWSQTAELTSSDGAAGDWFGGSLSLSGSTMVVGASKHAVAGADQQGAAYVFVKRKNVWSQSAELTSADGAAGDLFGSSVAVAGATMVIGAPAHVVGGHVGQGAAYVFVRKGTAWNKVAEPVAANGAGSDAFGSAVALQGKRTVIGAPGKSVNGNTAQGVGYVFEA